MRMILVNGSSMEFLENVGAIVVAKGKNAKKREIVDRRTVGGGDPLRKMIF